MGQWRGPPTGGGTKNPFACTVVVEVGVAVTSDFEIPKHLVALLIRNCSCPYCYSRSVLGDARRVGDRCRLSTCLLRRTRVGRSRLDGGGTLRRVVRGFDCRGSGLPIRRRHQSRFRNDSLAPHPRGWRNWCCRRHVVCVTRAGGFCLTRDWGGIALRVRKDGADDFVIKETIVDRGSFKRCFTVIKL